MITNPSDLARQVTLVQFRDVQAQVELELRLTRAHEQYRTLLRTMSEAALVIDGELRIESANDQALKLLGVQHDQLIGWPLFTALELWDEDGQPVTGSSSEALLPTEQVGTLERWQSIRLGDGSRVPLRLAVASFGRGRYPGGGFVVTLDRAPSPHFARVPTDLDRRAIQAMAGLTPREGDVLELLARGATVVDIAEERRLSQHSVRGHVKRLLVKLGVHTQLQAVLVAARCGMVDLCRPADESLPERATTPD
jgi:PAS domain S-box-containing protein